MTSKNASVRQSPQENIKNIRNKNRDYYSDPRGMGALKDLQQTFPHPWLYVAELLQNAIDENAKHIDLTVEDDGSLEFEHDGKAFSQADVESLCARGLSGKGAATVGFMGIGFKSVFRSFTTVEVASGPWQFRLAVPVSKGDRYGDSQRDWLGSVLPEWGDDISSPSPQMNCRFRLSGRLGNLPGVEEDLAHVLGKDETLLALLAWQGVKQLKWNDRTWSLKQKKTGPNDVDDATIELTSRDETGSARRWVLFSRKYQPSDGAIRRFLEHRQLTPSEEEKEKVYRDAGQRRHVALFFEVDEQGDPRPIDRGAAFALLPTGVTLPIGLHVQADWLLAVNRRQIMQIEGNEWHQEILQQIPGLLANYLAWLTNSPRTLDGKWQRGYNALPSDPKDEQETDLWFTTESFRRDLRVSIQELEWLPVPPENAGMVTFVAPSKGRVLPRPLANAFEDRQADHRRLFGNSVYSRTILGKQALRCLENLGLTCKLSASELAAQWQRGRVGKWIEDTQEDKRLEALANLLGALAELDEEEEWQTAQLLCLPTEDDNWTYQNAARRHPADWDILARNDEIREALEPLLGDKSSLISWQLDRYLRASRSRAAALEYLDVIKQPNLEDITREWWAGLPRQVSPEQQKLILQFTCWVRDKHSQRPGLVKKLLSTNNVGATELLPSEENLLAEPYAGASRRSIYPNLPAVTNDYEQADPNATPADWRSFFEKLKPPPHGRFSLKLIPTRMSRTKLREMMGDNYNPPDLRVTYAATQWRGQTISSHDYWVLDAELPREARERLVESQSGPSREEVSATAFWIEEAPAMLTNYKTMRLAYIGYNESTKTEILLTREASWVRDLCENRWVYAKSGAGPFLPADVLQGEDPARPEAPVADLPKNLIAVLDEAGISFGSNLPDAPALDRLRLQGPTAQAAELLNYLRAAKDEAKEDEEKQAFLRRTLHETNLFPLPLGRRSPDDHVRVPLGRVVWNARGRSTFGNWLASAESFSHETSERSLFEFVDSIEKIPGTTTVQQAMRFLSWVWKARPDAESVRQLLPAAYQYIKEDLDGESAKTWGELRQYARVFIQGKREWKLVSDDDVYLDDVHSKLLRDAVSDITLATAGHLGETTGDQVKTAKLVGLNLLSSRFHLKIAPTGPLSVPNAWQQRFGLIQQRLQQRVRLGIDSPETQPDNPPVGVLKLSRWQQLEAVVYDQGERVQSTAATAGFHDGRIAVTGEPTDFAKAVCEAVFDYRELSDRRDLMSLLPDVVIDLVCIDDEAHWAPHREENQLVREPSRTEDESEDEELRNERKHPEDFPDSTDEADEAELDENQQTKYEKKGRGYTAEDRETKAKYHLHQLNELASVGVIPKREPDDRRKRDFQSDEVYRNAVEEYERGHGRIPVAKAATQAGHDIDSYVRGEGGEERLARRIEVKGKSVPWHADEIVETSDTQYDDAKNRTVEDDTKLTHDFDYWLYIVETTGDGTHSVLPIRNPALRAEHYEFRADTWRHFAEREDEDT